MEITDRLPQAFAPGSFKGRNKAQKELVENLKAQWKLLWSERFSDKAKAEDVSVGDYTSLRIERGTVIRATRDYKPLSFKEILRQNVNENPENYLQPDVQVGGWNKFIKTMVTSHNCQSIKRTLPEPEKRVVQQSKKGGRGWLHRT